MNTHCVLTLYCGTLNMRNNIDGELNRYGGGVLLVKQSCQCDRSWHQLIPISKISGSRNWQDVHASKERGWLLCDLLIDERV